MLCVNHDEWFAVVALCGSEAGRETDVSTGRLTVCVSIVAQPIQQTSSWPDNPVGPETKAEGSYCQRPA